MIQVLISTMFLKDPIELLQKMRIRTRAIIIDQCDYSLEERIQFQGNEIEIYHTTERGLSRSRNMAISHASADILVLADDDFWYSEGYAAMIEEAYRQFPKADAIIFQAEKENKSLYRSFAEGKLKKRYRYSVNSIRITIKRSALIESGVRFDARFGTGSEIKSGEDNIFIGDCFRKKLKFYSTQKILCHGLEAERASTWFSGFDRDYFLDRGRLYKRLMKNYPLLIFFLAIKNHRLYKKETSFFKAVGYMFKGARQWKRKE